MNQSDRIALIANAVAQSDNKVNKKFANLLEELKAEKLAEDLVLEHGIQHASDDDVKEEFVSLDAVEREEDEDFDIASEDEGCRTRQCSGMYPVENVVLAIPEDRC